jgi:adenylate cyclase
MTTRRLAAILAADVVGFSAMMEKDEEGTLERLKALEHDIIQPRVTAHHGRVVKTMGDGFLCEFGSPVEAVRCALEVQEVATASEESGRGLLLRMGLNLGDIIMEPGGDIYGDGVNVAARLEQMAEPGGICISGAIHDHIEGKVDRTFESRGEQQVKNIARPVRVYALAGVKTTNREPKALPLPDKPSIAVLPFTNMSGDPEQEYFADGIVEDIITALSRIKWFFVIARNSSFTYKGRAVDVKQVGRELGVRYVLEGSIRRAGNRIRINGQLIDAGTGHHVWADRYEGNLEDVFDLQDQITERVVGSIEPTVQSVEIERAKAKATQNLRAYDLCLRALPNIYLTAATREDNDESIRLLHQAIQLDPDYSAAKAIAAWAYVIRKAQSWSTPQEDDEGLRLADASLAAHRDDPTVLACAGHAIAFLGQRHDAALNALDRAVTLNNNSARALVSNAWVRIYVGEPEKALSHFQRAIRLSPLDPEMGYTLSGMAFAHLMSGRSEEALKAASRAVEEAPKWSSGHRALVFSLVESGRLEEARAAARRLNVLSPTFSISWLSRTTAFRDRKFVTRYAEALRVAGIPE